MFYLMSRLQDTLDHCIPGTETQEKTVQAYHVSTSSRNWNPITLAYRLHNVILKDEKNYGNNWNILQLLQINFDSNGYFKQYQKNNREIIIFSLK
jgi:hypothetical protein